MERAQRTPSHLGRHERLLRLLHRGVKAEALVNLREQQGVCGVCASGRRAGGLIRCPNAGPSLATTLLYGGSFPQAPLAVSCCFAHQQHIVVYALGHRHHRGTHAAALTLPLHRRRAGVAAVAPHHEQHAAGDGVTRANSSLGEEGALLSMPSPPLLPGKCSAWTLPPSPTTTAACGVIMATRAEPACRPPTAHSIFHRSSLHAYSGRCGHAFLRVCAETQQRRARCSKGVTAHCAVHSNACSLQAPRLSSNAAMQQRPRCLSSPLDDLLDISAAPRRAQHGAAIHMDVLKCEAQHRLSSGVQQTVPCAACSAHCTSYGTSSSLWAPHSLPPPRCASG